MKTDTRTAGKASVATLLISISIVTMSSQLKAQTYTATELEPALSLSVAHSVASGVAAGYISTTGSFSTARATLWDGLSQIDLHPDFLDDTINGVEGRSTVQGSADNLQVGWGVGPTTNNRAVPLVWNGSAASATTLAIPFDNAGGQALATDGNQITGYGIPLIKDGTEAGPSHAIVWDIASDTAVDLTDGGDGARALGVGGGQQVGYVIKGIYNAALWNGSAKSLTVIHPKNAVISIAYATDGLFQVGYSGYDVRVRAEAAKGNKDERFDYATVWTGTAESAFTIHPYGFTHSYALAVNGQWIAGYASDRSKIGTPGYNHAMVWDATYQAVDLHDFLPASFVGSQAFSVDEQGNIAGVALTADGQRHAVVWWIDPPQ